MCDDVVTNQSGRHHLSTTNHHYNASYQLFINLTDNNKMDSFSTPSRSSSSTSSSSSRFNSARFSGGGIPAYSSLHDNKGSLDSTGSTNVNNYEQQQFPTHHHNQSPVSFGRISRRFPSLTKLSPSKKPLGLSPKIIHDSSKHPQKQCASLSDIVSMVQLLRTSLDDNTIESWKRLKVMAEKYARQNVTFSKPVSCEDNKDVEQSWNRVNWSTTTEYNQ